MVLLYSLITLPINREDPATRFSSVNVCTSLLLVYCEFRKMGSKALLVLVLFMATIILISAEIAPKDLDEKSDTNDGNSVQEFFNY